MYNYLPSGDILWDKKNIRKVYNKMYHNRRKKKLEGFNEFNKMKLLNDDTLSIIKKYIL
jgi:hypothetical protein